MMLGIIVRREDGREEIAGAIPHVPEELRLLPLAVPMARDADARAVRQGEAAHVQSVGGGMLAQLAPSRP